MTKEQVVNFRDNIAKDKMIKIVCDNQHIFYDNIAQYPPVVWDDSNETFTVIRTNPDPNGQVKYPFETVQTSYEMIQFMHCYDTAQSAIKLMNEIGSNLPEDKITHFNKFVSESIGRKDTTKNYSENPMFVK